MDQSELIISIVLDNDNAFHNLSAHETALFMTSCKNAWTSKALQKMHNKHRAMYVYNKAWHLMERACLVLKHYRTLEDLDLSDKLFKEHKEIVASFHNETSEVKDCLSRILIAEYKELLYNLAYDNIDNSSYYHHQFLFEIFKEDMLQNLSFCNIDTHIHDQSHYAFMDIEDDHYKFYTQIEKRGKNLLQDDRCIKFINMIEGNDTDDEEDTDYEDEDE
jgi:hypothetical protein